MAQRTELPSARRSLGGEVPGGGDRRQGLAFVVPALLLITVFLILPALWTLYLGLTDYRLTGVQAAHPKVVGTANYTHALGDKDFRDALGRTLLFVLGSAVIGQNVLGFVLAWSLRSARRWARALVETLVLLAWILPGVVVAWLWIAFLKDEGGTLNAILHTPGRDWWFDHPMGSLIVFNVWRGTAFSMMLFTAALSSVPPSQLESARLAGASGWQQLRDVVLPAIRGHILTNTLLISLWTFNDFTPFLITAGGPDRRSEIMSVYVYRTALGDGRLGFGAAISLIMILINLVIALVYLRALRDRGRREPREAVAA